jgi:chromosome condensin MukBEF ATPase and DNA-binding subunit MukB
MKAKINKERMIAAGTTALLVISLIATGLYYRSNQSLQGNLDKEKLKSESLLSEKLALSKEAEKLKADIESWKGKSAETDRLLNEALAQVGKLERTVSALNRDNANLARVKKELADLKQIRQDLEARLQALDEENRRNAQLAGDLNAELAALRVENAELKNNIRVFQADATNDFRVETLRGKKKQKLTVNAAKTRKLQVSFEIPQEMSENVKFTIVTPQGREIKSDDKSLSHRIVDDGRTLTASLSPYSGEFEVSRRVEMSYLPDKKLEPGVYKIRIYNGETFAGSCQLRLR